MIHFMKRCRTGLGDGRVMAERTGQLRIFHDDGYRAWVETHNVDIICKECGTLYPARFELCSCQMSVEDLEQIVEDVTRECRFAPALEDEPEEFPGMTPPRRLKEPVSIPVYPMKR